MSMIFLARATVTLGMTTKDRNGNTVSHTPPKCEVDPHGGSVIVGELDPETMEQKGTAEVFGDFDPAGYLKRAAQMLGPGRPGNIPDFEGIVKDMVRGSFDHDCPFLEHCHSFTCEDCIVHQWIEEQEEAEE